MILHWQTVPDGTQDSREDFDRMKAEEPPRHVRTWRRLLPPRYAQAPVASAPLALVPQAQDSRAMVASVPPVVREVPMRPSLPTDAGFAADCAIAPGLDVSASATPWWRAARALLSKAVHTARMQTTADAAVRATAMMDGAL